MPPPRDELQHQARPTQTEARQPPRATQQPPTQTQARPSPMETEARQPPRATQQPPMQTQATQQPMMQTPHMEAQQQSTATKRRRISRQERATSETEILSDAATVLDRYFLIASTLPHSL